MNPNHKKFWCYVPFPTEVNDNRLKPKTDSFWNQVDSPCGGYRSAEPYLFFTREEAEKAAKAADGMYWRHEARKIKKKERR